MATSNGTRENWIVKHWSMVWPLIMALVVVAGTWATIGLRLENLEIRVEKHDVHFDVVDGKTNDIQVSLRGIESDLQWIKATLEELKTRGD